MNALLRIVLSSWLLVGLVACAGTGERWAEVRFTDISYPNLYRSVADVLASEGFPSAVEDTSSGTLESEWQYGTSVREVRGPSRRKVHVLIEEAEPPPEGAEITGPVAQWVVRLRVAEEIIRKGGILARNIRQSDDWEEYRDKFEDAELLAEKIRALLAEHHVMVHTRPEIGS